MNWIRFMNRLFGARIQINEPDRVQFETIEPQVCFIKSIHLFENTLERNNKIQLMIDA